MRATLILLLACGFTITCSGVEMTTEAKNFKAQHLKSLKPPDFDDAPVWKELVRIGATYRDEEIANRIFAIAREPGMDGYFSTNYANHLSDFLKANPGFFVRSADKFYAHQFDEPLGYLVNATGDIPFAELDKALSSVKKSDPDYALVKKFQLEAKRKRRIKR